jgi:hypothetical protein
MPTWNPPPPTNNRGVPYRLLRVPAKGTLKGVITSTEPVAANTHYVANRTIPCESPNDCAACQQGHSYRYHCYTGLLLSATFEHVILELTAAASETLRNYHKLNKCTRGVCITAQRPSGRHNGRVILAIGQATNHADQLPDEPDLMAVLCHIWGIKYDPLHDIKPNFGNRHSLYVPRPADDDARNTA